MEADAGEITTLGTVVAQTGGVIQTGPFGSQLHASDYRPTGTPLIMPINLGDNEIREHGISRVGDYDARRLQRHALREGDIVFSRRGDVGRRAIVRKKEAGWLCGTGCLAARFGADASTVNSAYVAEYLGSAAAQTWLSDNAVGGTMPNLNTSILSALPIWLPSKSKQDYIVAAIEDARATIGSIERLIDKKRAIKQGLAQQLLTGQARLGRDWDAWKRVRLASVATGLRGAGLSKDSLKATGVASCILYGELFTTYGRRIDHVISRTDEVGSVRSIAGDVLVPGSTTTVARDLATASAIHVGGTLIGGDTNILRPSKLVDPDWLAYYISARLGNYIAEVAQGTTIKHLYVRDLLGCEVDLPSIEEQRAISHALSDADDELDVLIIRLEKARAMQAGMLQGFLASTPAPAGAGVTV